MSQAIEVHGLVKQYDSLMAVDHIDFSVPAGKVFAFLGPNGAGKTTTTEILEGLRRRTEGDVRVLDLDPWKEGYQLHRKIGVIPQDFRFFEKLTPREGIEYYAALFGTHPDPMELLHQVALEDKSDSRYDTLSGGQKQKMGLALALTNDPQICFLDEPTTGLDPHARRAIWEVIRTLRKEGRTVFLTTHYLEEAELLADQVAIIHHGQIIAAGTPGDIIRSRGRPERLVIEGPPGARGLPPVPWGGLGRGPRRTGGGLPRVEGRGSPRPQRGGGEWDPVGGLHDRPRTRSRTSSCGWSARWTTGRSSRRPVHERSSPCRRLQGRGAFVPSEPGRTVLLPDLPDHPDRALRRDPRGERHHLHPAGRRKPRPQLPAEPGVPGRPEQHDPGPGHAGEPQRPGLRGRAREQWLHERPHHSRRVRSQLHERHGGERPVYTNPQDASGAGIAFSAVQGVVTYFNLHAACSTCSPVLGITSGNVGSQLYK